MHSHVTRPRVVASVLAVVLAAEAVGAVAASMPDQPVSAPRVEQAPAGRILSGPALQAQPWTSTGAIHLEPIRSVVPAAALSAAPVQQPAAAPQAASKAKAKPEKPSKAKEKPAAKPKPRASAKSAPKAKSTGTRKVSASDFKGTNRVWIPALGINKAVQAFPCDRNRPPDNYMYRWGCAGANNVYLMGHAYSVMKPLHDAYYNGRLKVGLKAYYAGSNGTVRVYSVRWWKKTLPTPDASWAWAAQSEPSMTLQTCVGKDSRYRLMVRLVEVDG